MPARIIKHQLKYLLYRKISHNQDKIPLFSENLFVVFRWF
jgi:hypothetical protein